MKEIKANGIDVLFVEVPEEIKSWDDDVFTIRDDSYVRFWDKSGHDSLIDLPSGKWELMGKSTELTDSQMKEICEQYPIVKNNRLFFKNYGKQIICKERPWVDTVQESYLSLLEANGIDSNKNHLVLKRI